MINRRQLIPALIIGLLVIWYAPLVGSVAAPQIIKITQPPADTLVPVVGNNTLLYPKLGITAPINATPNSSPLVVRDWPTMRRALEQGVSLSFPEDSWPESPFAYLVGHSSDTYPHAYSTIFASLGQAEVGDSFYLNVDNVQTEFVVDRLSTLKPTDVPGWQALEAEARASTDKRIAMVTCWPPLTTRLRLVVLAHAIPTPE